MIAHELLRSDRFDGVAPAIVEPVAVQNASARQNEPRVTLFASTGPNLAAFGQITTVNGLVVSLDDLQPDQVYLNEDAAEELLARERRQAPPARRRALDARARQGDRPTSTAPARTARRCSRSCRPRRRSSTRKGQVRHVLISNLGDETGGVRHTDEITKLLEPTLARYGLELDPVKRDALEAADEQGNAFMSLFTTFGSFSIFAGFLLIFLIFVMLAAERRGELGIARAVGTRRGHLIQMYVYEGLAYDLLAAAVGAAIGVAVAFGMVFILSSALGTSGITIEHDVQLSSVVVAYSVGVLLTFVVVVLSAWRVSRLNIVTAIRNLPEPPVHKRRKRRWIGGLVAMALGSLLTLAGVSSAEAVPFILGISLFLIGAVPVAQALGVPQRLAYTAAGLGIVVLCLLPFDWLDALARTNLRMNFSVWIVSGILIVLGASWVIVYNADLLLGIVTATAGPDPLADAGAAPVGRLPVAEPLPHRRDARDVHARRLHARRRRHDHGLVHAFVRRHRDVRRGLRRPRGFGSSEPDRRSRGRDRGRARPARVRLPRRRGAVVSPRGGTAARPLRVALRELPGAGRRRRVRDAHDVHARGARSRLRRPVAGAGRRARARDRGRARRSAARQLGCRPDPAGLPAEGLLPRGRSLRPGSDRGPRPADRQDAEAEGGRRARRPGAATRCRGSRPRRRRSERPSADRVRPTVFYVDLAEGADPRAEAQKLESAFLANGVEADSLEQLLDDAVGSSWTFNRLIQGFMGLGLVVGVAALGVISARAVVERRQQIGILRAIGFRRRMIQLSFLLESSFIALTAILVGTVFGLIVSHTVITDVSSQPGYEMVTLQVPWLNLAIVFTVVYLVALATTLAPAVRASRIYPAEALRYE